MATFETLPSFHAGWRGMTRGQQDTFRKVVLDAFTPDLMTPGRPFRPALSIKPVPRHPGVYEMTWSPQGRAAFSYGAARRADEPHVIWWQITAAAGSYAL